MNDHVPTPQGSHDEAIRAHSFDGIQEFDKRLPNWWLLTLYVMVLFAFAYWFYYHWPSPGELLTQGERVEQELARIQMEAVSRGGGVLTDEQLWKMSRDAQVVSAGRATFLTTCASCHGPELKGGIGPNLTDAVWIHGGRPEQVVETITKGVLEKGMPTWGPQLGRKRIAEVAAFILSHHPSP